MCIITLPKNRETWETPIFRWQMCVCVLVCVCVFHATLRFSASHMTKSSEGNNDPSFPPKMFSCKFIAMNDINHSARYVFIGHKPITITWALQPFQKLPKARTWGFDDAGDCHYQHAGAISSDADRHQSGSDLHCDLQPRLKRWGCARNACLRHGKSTAAWWDSQCEFRILKWRYCTIWDHILWWYPLT